MIIQSTRVWVSGQFMEAQIEMENGTITGIYTYGEKPVDADYGTDRIVPGFIDVHTHGAYGFDTNDGDEEGLRNWVKRVPGDEGVTSILPATITQSEEILTKALENIVHVVESGYEGADIVGIHFEGPYLDTAYKGAQPEEFILDSDIEQFERYVKASHNMIKIVTYAPEHDPDYRLTKYCAAHDIVASMGHSAANYKQALLGVANGARSMTHVYNGMTAYNHREPNLVGAAMRFRDVYGEIICDGCHSSLVAVNNLFAAKGRDYTVMISDSLRPKGLPQGIYTSGGLEIEVYPDGSAHLTSGKKPLAGSTLQINRGLQILVEKAMIPFDAALNSCTINPATMLRIDNKKGKLMAGHDADIVVLADNYDIVQTYCKGTAMK
ncbi:MAG: N-acetylglucosamine-6-phosphate deacetylase [Erysipelotrichaceae bacterium]|nr:N-acetylglucosamine-6-phosphate deacetylase [Erysipelotrichaceae bacterium]